MGYELLNRNIPKFNLRKKGRKRRRRGNSEGEEKAKVNLRKKSERSFLGFFY